MKKGVFKTQFIKEKTIETEKEQRVIFDEIFKGRNYKQFEYDDWSVIEDEKDK